MPGVNWKDPASTVRLLSAVLAAHPELKLKYDGKPNIFLDSRPKILLQLRFRIPNFLPSSFVWSLMTLLLPDVAKMFGGGTKYFAIWSQMKMFNENSQMLRDAFERGEDPITIQLSQSASRGGKPKAEGNKDQHSDIYVLPSHLIIFFSANPITSLTPDKSSARLLVENVLQVPSRTDFEKSSPTPSSSMRLWRKAPIR